MHYGLPSFDDLQRFFSGDEEDADDVAADGRASGNTELVAILPHCGNADHRQLGVAGTIAGRVEEGPAAPDGRAG